MISTPTLITPSMQTRYRMLTSTTHASPEKSRYATWPLALTMVAAALAVACVLPPQATAQTPPAPEVKTALLIIDVQQFYFPDGAVPLENPSTASLNVKKMLAKWREDERPIIHVGHNVRQGGEFHPDVAPRKGEKVIIKDEVSAFNGTDLLTYLQENQIEQLVICGMQTHMCVEAAVRAAHDLGFSCIMVHDACATRDLNFGDSTVSAAEVHSSTLGTLHRVYAEVVDTETVLNSY
jgi:nicotinamidase-related amidase